jgi:hypothetical protein
MVRVAGDPSVQGIEIWTAGAPPPPTPTPTPPPATFIKGINLNGGAVTVNGNPWLSDMAARADGFSNSNATFSNTRTYSPAVDPDTNTMLRSGIWCSVCNVSFSQTLPNGSYDIYLWTVEDYQTNYRAWNLVLQNVQVASGLGRMPLNEWRRHGPFPATVTNGLLTATMVRVAGDPSVQGIEIWTP